jgi:hypothetical protein
VGEGKLTLYLATAVDEYKEGGSNQRFFPKSEEQIRQGNSYISRAYNNVNGTWKIKIIPIQIWTDQ